MNRILLFLGMGLVIALPGTLATVVCEESDAGDDPFHYGVTVAAAALYTDTCDDLHTLTEWYCLDGSAVQVTHPCPVECQTVDFFYQESPWRAGQCLHGCGDGILDGQEECDDGNLDDGDGCSMRCVLEADGRAVPEFSSAAVILTVAAAMGLILVRRKP